MLLARNVAGRYPGLDEVLADVRQDAERKLLDEAQEKAIDAIVGTYEVRRNLEKTGAAGS